MRAVTSAVLVGLFVCACGSEAPTPNASGQAARESAIEGVPLPPAAKLRPGGEPLRNDFKSEMYSVVGMTFDELDAWYQQRMPKGKPWNGWRWQEPIAGKMYVARDYCHEKRDGISVTILREVAGNPPSIFITQDGSGSGCQSQP